ncbi:MAG: SAM-dependent methyltransferase [Muribaculaceae bacterium]|nr:SAM-dependent methyltransferase [Muribaculaceae bacterium]
MEKETGLFMLPVAIGEGNIERSLPKENIEIAKRLSYFIVENVRTARRCLKKMAPEIDISSLTFYELNEHTPTNEISGYLEPLRRGESMGLMSEAGCPGVADPGAAVVKIAQREGLKIIPLVGPSSILLSLMGSGLNGQLFTFNGYLPVDAHDREKRIRELEALSRKTGGTQIFIETPYRNSKMLESLLKALGGETLLCVAANITTVEEQIITRKVKEWRKLNIMLEKVPTIFLFNSGENS